MPLAPGTRLGAYEVIAALGAGGMGEVYRARDTRLRRDVALKVLPPEVTREPGRLERFDREARAIAALNHPHIVTIYSTEEADGIRFLTRRWRSRSNCSPRRSSLRLVWLVLPLRLPEFDFVSVRIENLCECSVVVRVRTFQDL